MMEHGVIAQSHFGLTVVETHDPDEIGTDAESPELLALECGRKVFENYDDEPEVVLETSDGWVIGGASHMLVMSPRPTVYSEEDIEAMDKDAGGTGGDADTLTDEDIDSIWDGDDYYEGVDEAGDKGSARDLVLFIENDAALYRQQHQPILKNAATKVAQGKYDSKLALKLFGYLIENGAKKYHKENDMSGTWHATFDKATRLMAATELRDSFEAEAKLGNYEDLVPKKYKGKTKWKKMLESVEGSDNVSETSILTFPVDAAMKFARINEVLELDEQAADFKSTDETISMTLPTAIAEQVAAKIEGATVTEAKVVKVGKPADKQSTDETATDAASVNESVDERVNVHEMGMQAISDMPLYLNSGTFYKPAQKGTRLDYEVARYLNMAVGEGFKAALEGDSGKAFKAAVRKEMVKTNSYKEVAKEYKGAFTLVTESVEEVELTESDFEPVDEEAVEVGIVGVEKAKGGKAGQFDIHVDMSIGGDYKSVLKGLKKKFGEKSGIVGVTAIDADEDHYAFRVEAPNNGTALVKFKKFFKGNRIKLLKTREFESVDETAQLRFPFAASKAFVSALETLGIAEEKADAQVDAVNKIVTATLDRAIAERLADTIEGVELVVDK